MSQMFPIAENTYLQLPELMYQAQAATPVTQPRWLAFNHELADLLQLPSQWRDTMDGLALYAGNQLAPWCQPLALAYSGHQFGQLNPRLGDGRALLLAEVTGLDGLRYDIQLKGSGPTPFSRRGDGRAALGPVLREYLISEWMHAVGVPTTRALAAVSTGDLVFRDTALPGAVLTRIARSHLRIGSMQYVSMAGSAADVETLIHYTLARHYPDALPTDNPALTLLTQVAKAQAQLIAQWMQLGFIHGVMNTDNMSLSGETIDYGPCAFMDSYVPSTKFSSIDSQGRYAYRNQPPIAQWNLARFAESMLAQIDPDESRAIELATSVLNKFVADYQQAFYQGFAEKLGLRHSSLTRSEPIAADKAAAQQLFIDETLQLMADLKVDFTAFFRRLADVLEGNAESLLALACQSSALQAWLERWRALTLVSPAELRAKNPAFIPRNQTVEAILASALAGDLAPFQRFVAAAKTPFVDDADYMAIPEEAPYCTFCGT